MSDSQAVAWIVEFDADVFSLNGGMIVKHFKEVTLNFEDTKTIPWVHKETHNPRNVVITELRSEG